MNILRPWAPLKLWAARYYQAMAGSR
jgi:hypothetical protein